jgi:lambda family phage portal protein
MIRRLWSSIRAAGATWSQSMFGGSQGAYWATDPRREILENLARIAGASSANELISAHGPRLRAISRQLVRNHPSARALIEGSTAVHVGTGIDLVLDTGDTKLDEALQPLWEIARDHAGVHGESLFELQAQAWREKVIGGGCLWRWVTIADRLKQSLNPSAILPLDEDWFDERSAETTADGVTICAGVKLDRWGRMLGAFIRNPEQFGVAETEFLGADKLNYIFERYRPLQARGEPELCSILETLYQEASLIAAELQSAKNTAAYSVFLTSPHGAAAIGGATKDAKGNATTSIPLGAVIRGMPGEQATMLSHTRPSQQIAPFSKFLKGRMSASAGMGQRWLDRDISDASYSSIRADGQDQERISTPKREWFGHATAGRYLAHCLPGMALQLGLKKIPPLRYRLLPDEPAYVDPYKDEQASMLRIANGKSTFEMEIARTGKDPRQVLRKLEQELQNPLLKQIFLANLNVQFADVPQLNSAIEDPAQQPAPAKTKAKP